MGSEEHRRGRLVVFLGAVPGVGKTTAMLREGTRLAGEGTDVVIGLVDELAHTNVTGSRHDKRWQDVEELLASGIGVITSLNVSHRGNRVRPAATRRSTFDLDSVTVLHRVGERWRPDFALRERVQLRPDESALSAELGDGRVMVLSARPSADRNAQLLDVFVETLRLRRQRDQLARLSHPAQGQMRRQVAR